MLRVDGFDGPLDWLLEMARAQRIDLARLSIIQLVDAFIAALEPALAPHEARAELSRWGEWLVMAATLTLLRSRLRLPPDAPDARAAQDEAEALRRQFVEQAAIRAAAAWLDRRPQLGHEMFARSGLASGAAHNGRTTDIADLFRACLVALRVPEQEDGFQLRQIELWRVSDAMAGSNGRWRCGRPGSPSPVFCRMWPRRVRTASFAAVPPWPARSSAGLNSPAPVPSPCDSHSPGRTSS